MNQFIKAAVYTSRSIVGSLFIISGLIKMNDPFGFSYKLEEYFSEKALGFPELIPYSLGLAVFICVAEVLLGVAILVWAKQKLSTALVLLLILFFTWLTYYTKECDPLEMVTIEIGGEMVETTRDCVRECGCFGNAIKFTPQQSFNKDIFLLVWSVILFVFAFFIEKKEHFDLSVKRNKHEYMIVLAASLLSVVIFSLQLLDWMLPVLFTALCIFVAEFIRRRLDKAYTDWIVAGAVAVICLIFSFKTYNYLPSKDYRPYAEGESICENMKSAEELGLKPPVYALEYTVKNKITGQDSIMLSTDWIKVYNTDHFKKTYEVTNYDGAEILLEEGYEPRIKDFRPEDFYGDPVTDDVLGNDGHTLIFMSKDLLKIEGIDMSAVTELYQKAKQKGIKIIALVNGASMEQIQAFQKKNALDFPFYLMDDVEMKTMIRSNPGLIHLDGCVVKDKYSWASFPSFDDLDF